MNKVFYLSPFISKVVTVKSVLNSAEAINKTFKKNNFKEYIIDAVHERKNFEDEIKKKKIELIYLNKNSDEKIFAAATTVKLVPVGYLGG